MNLYWKCQFAGWTLIALWSVVISLVLGTFQWLGAGLVLSTSALGLLLTHGFRRFIHRWEWKNLPLHRLGPRVAAASVGLGTVMGTITLPVLTPMVSEEARMDHVALSHVVGASFTLLGWFLIYFSYHYYRRSREAAAAEFRLRIALRENELRTLRAQLNPHFLFNSLNSLRALIPECPERAQEAVTALAGLLRHTLQLSSSSTVSLSQELEAGYHYLALEKIRFEERLDIRVEVEPGILDQPVPPMLLQNLLENALKHGIAPRQAGGRVALAGHARGSRVVLRVTNPGRLGPTGGEGGPAGAGTGEGGLRERGLGEGGAGHGGLRERGRGEGGLGLSNAREQLRLLYGSEASLELRQSGPDEVTCEVVLPRRAGPEPGEGGVPGGAEGAFLPEIPEILEEWMPGADSGSGREPVSA
jgi:two-component system, LytTR family, sensor kinase